MERIRPLRSRGGLSRIRVDVHAGDDADGDGSSSRRPRCVSFSINGVGSFHDVHHAFLACVRAQDGNGVAELLHVHPYHFPAQLFLAEIYIRQQQPEQAMELIERIMFLFESIWHGDFRPFDRIDTNRVVHLPWDCNQLNRMMLVSMFRYVHMLGDGGYHRAALEWSKWMLSLDPTDPCGVLLMMDVYALRCKEYAFVSSVVANYPRWQKRFNTEDSMELRDLPNWAFAEALALFHSTHHEKTSSSSSSSSSSSLSSSSVDEVSILDEPCSQRLVRALVMFPSLLPLLLEKCPIGGVGPIDGSGGSSRAYERVHSHPYFASATLTRETYASYLIPLMVHRQYPLWRVPRVLHWLLQCANHVCDRIDQTSMNRLDGALDDWLWGDSATALSERIGFQRHVTMCHFEPSMTLMPRIRTTRLFSFLPDDDVGSDGTNDVVLCSTSNLFLLFFHTLFPWTRIPNTSHDRVHRQ